MNDYNIKSILDIPEWEKLQDELALLTNTAIVAIDYKGTPVSKHSGRTDFCTVIRENPISRNRCYKCDSLAGLEAVRLNRPFIYLCHCGIVDVAVPVVVGDRYLGAVMFGEVRIPNGGSDAKVERLVSEISSFNKDDRDVSADLFEKYNKLPEQEYEQIEQIARFLDALVKYVVNIAVKSRADAMKYEYLAKLSIPPTFNGEGKTADTWRSKLAEMSQPPSSAAYGAPLAEVQPTSPVYPAVLYIREHPREMISMNQMADLCHLSPGYFSRLFKHELDENFTDYMNRTKVELAKEMLSSTDSNVTLIATELGFQDASYFVKVFKKYQGITPTAYRKSKH